MIGEAARGSFPRRLAFFASAFGADNDFKRLI
ncbi:hypothetical protein AWB69_00189 [Caballeronia udeis]|uniref:Uncharacterized protein n=1 Tax=Caballeronia udeis TaxID=1232866 RepID=A0A158ESM8_9BURK|nr:hypothetical protein AWB69_00189 [Caballeronia udeis]